MERQEDNIHSQRRHELQAFSGIELIRQESRLEKKGFHAYKEPGVPCEVIIKKISH